jgi:hypothetical protein
MELEAFERSLYRSVRIEPRQWACALLLGEARRRSNPARARTANRGDAGNQAVDLHGALGDLLLYGIARRCRDKEALGYMQNQLYRSEGGRSVKGPDLRFTDGGRVIGIDVKTFDCSPKNRFFAINDDKHAKLRGKCIGYVGLICPVFAPQACLTRLIPYEHVSGWECAQLRRGNSGSPSRNLRIETAVRLYTPQSYDIEENRSAAFDRREIVALARKAGTGSMADWLTELVPTIRKAIQTVQESL